LNWEKEEVEMAVSVMIKRRVKQGEQARKLIPMILQLRALATYQPGYISGETLRNIEHPEECLVISNWESLADWKIWLQRKERKAINSRIEALTGDPTEYDIYESMVGRAVQEIAR
jgi:heme-degrading monooxygenase HmoA